VPQPPPDPRQGRDERGRFAPGNASGRGRGWKRAIARLAGSALAPEHRRLAGDAASLYRAVLAELPHGGPLVSPLVAEHSRCAVLAPRFAERALELGLDTEAGRAALEVSMRLGQRAERVAISMLDLSTKLADARRRNRKNTLATLLAGGEEVEDEPDTTVDPSENENASAWRTGAGDGDEQCT
jgi:hypothetical protein